MRTHTLNEANSRCSSTLAADTGTANGAPTCSRLGAFEFQGVAGATPGTLSRLQVGAPLGGTRLLALLLLLSVPAAVQAQFTYTSNSGVTSLGLGSLSWCTNLMAVRCRGDAPAAQSDLFYPNDPATVYYPPGKTGWGPTLGGRPTALWRPQALMSGVVGNQFGFTIDRAAGQTVVVEACANLGSPAWSPVATNTLISGAVRFSDPRWTNYNRQFYRLRSY